MFSTRTKLTIPLGLLTLGSGGVIPTLSQLSLPNWSFGGGASSLKSQDKTEISYQNLGLDNQNVKSFEHKHYSEDKSTNLEVQIPELTDSQFLKNQLETQKSQQNTLNIYSEVKKETETIKINTKSHNKVISAQEKLKPTERRQFKSALQKIQTFGKNNNGFSPRGPRPAKPASPRIQSLTEQEKKSISDFFTQFESLNKDQGTYSGELSRVSGESQNIQNVQSVCLPCIPSHLRKIGWVNKEMNVFETRPSFRRHPMLSHHYYSSQKALEPTKAQSTWGSWANSNHPYRYLFSSESEWIESVTQISNYWKAYYESMNNGGRLACSFLTMGALCSRDKGSLEQGIDNAKASLELKIGTKLMNLMNRL